MAYDKVVDSAVLDAGLKQIADAIREKGGTSDSLAFPTAMADAIAAIEAGGGGDAKFSYGTVSFAEDITNSEGTANDPQPLCAIEHELGAEPSVFVFTTNPLKDKNIAYKLVTFIVFRELPRISCYRFITNAYAGASSCLGSSIYSGAQNESDFFNETTATVTTQNATTKLPANVTYHWFAMA